MFTPISHKMFHILVNALTQHLLYRIRVTAVKLQIVYPPASKGLCINLDFVQCGARESHTCVRTHVCINAQLQSTVMDVPRQFCNAPWESEEKQTRSVTLQETNKNMTSEYRDLSVTQALFTLKKPECIVFGFTVLDVYLSKPQQTIVQREPSINHRCLLITKNSTRRRRHLPE